MRGLTAAERGRLEALFTEQVYDAGDVILKEDTASPGILLMRQGNASVSKRDMGGIDQPITDLVSPAVLGELELLCCEPCSATVRAKTAVAAVLFSVQDFERLLDRGDSAAVKLMRNLARALGRKLATSNEVYVDLAIWGRSVG